MQPSAIVDTYLATQNAGQVDRCMELIADDAVFDVGRGYYEGTDQVRTFLLMLIGRGSRTERIESRTEGDSVYAKWRQSDDDGRRLGIEWVELDAEVTVRDGKIALLRARPTPESLARLQAASKSRPDLTAEARRALERPT
jgi:SnoaL-like domain